LNERGKFIFPHSFRQNHQDIESLRERKDKWKRDSSKKRERAWGCIIFLHPLFLLIYISSSLALAVVLIVWSLSWDCEVKIWIFSVCNCVKGCDCEVELEVLIVYTMILVFNQWYHINDSCFGCCNFVIF